MAGTSEKDSIQAEIGQDVIDAAVRSVERHMEDGAVTVEVEAPAAAADEVSLIPPRLPRLPPPPRRRP